MSSRACLVAFAAYTLLAIALTFPLVLHLSTVVPHDIGDPLVSTSILWWNAHVVPFTAKWWNGFAFYPSPGMLAFSDHRLGESLIASPLQWLGLAPMGAYNLTLILTFPLCALSAHWLGFTLTKRHDAAAIAGLVYGFNPYRVAHLEHLELLAAYGLPATLVALHQFLATRRKRWIALFASALTVTGLCTSYYLLFFGVLIALWMIWFLRVAEWRTAVAIVAGGVASALALLPIAIGFWRIHQLYGFARPFDDIVTLSADLSSFVTASPMLVLWGWTAPLNGPERQLFPGLTVVTLVGAVGLVAILRRRKTDRDRSALSIVSATFAGLAMLAVAVAIAAKAFGPRRLSVGPIALTVGVPFKPLSLGLVAFGIAILLSAPVRAAFRRRSAFAFYVLATAALFVCSLGPKPKFLGQQFWYEPPYAWLMRLPLFSSSVRVPARFAMPAILALSAAGALAFVRTRFGARGARMAIVALSAAIIADGWLHALPLHPVPQAWTRSDVARFSSVVELPIAGDLFAETSAMMRSTTHGRPVVNGNSGYDPPEYWALRVAAEERDWSVLRAYTSSGPLLIAIEHARDAGGRTVDEVRALGDARYVGEDPRWTFFELPATAASPRCAGPDAPLAAARDNDGPVPIAMLTDRDPMTRWLTGHDGQQRGDMLELELERPVRPCAIRLSLGIIAHVYPRLLNVATSIDGTHWDVVFTGRTAAETVRGAIAEPRDIWLDVVPARQPPARFIRLQLDESRTGMPWVVAAVMVKGEPVAGAGH